MEWNTFSVKFASSVFPLDTQAPLNWVKVLSGFRGV